MNEIVKNLKERRSVREYNSKVVPDEVLKEMTLAGEYAPCGRGLQSPKIVVVQNEEDVETIKKLNARVMGGTNDPFYGAKTIIVVFGDKNVPFYIEDASLCIGNIMNAGYSLGVSTCWIHRAKESFEFEEGKALMKKWGVPENYVGVGNIAVGYSDAKPIAKPRKSDYTIFIK